MKIFAMHINATTGEEGTRLTESVLILINLSRLIVIDRNDSIATSPKDMKQL